MMQQLSRRTFLKRAPVAAVAIGVPSSALALKVHCEPVETPEEAIARLTQELVSAINQSAEWSEWTDWVPASSPKAGVFQLIARRKTVAFSGAGYYAVWNGKREEIFWIERDPAKDHATMGRCYWMTPRDNAGGPVWMFDDHLQTALAGDWLCGMTTSQRNFIRHVPVAVAAALPAMATAETSANGELLALIERHRVTLGIYEALCNKADSIHEDYDPSCLDAFNAAENEEEALLLAIAGFPVKSQADHIAKARYLLVRSDANRYWVKPELYGALLASLAGEWN